MFNIFGKNKQKDKRDIEQVIFDVAEHQNDEDFGFKGDGVIFPQYNGPLTHG